MVCLEGLRALEEDMVSHEESQHIESSDLISYHLRMLSLNSLQTQSLQPVRGIRFQHKMICHLLGWYIPLPHLQSPFLLPLRRKI